ncbi:MAG: T9SS type A sorting domain-containing protein [Bacteroidales bacterium]|nr:T9SS type A sorting domain-containing protein [Bacteroidales bacterium]
MIKIFFPILLLVNSFYGYANNFFNMEAIRDTSTLDIEIIDDWHIVEGVVRTRQQYISINVGELWEGQSYRIPVRFIVPVDSKATGMHITGGNTAKELVSDTIISSALDKMLLRSGVGLVRTVIQNGINAEQVSLQDAMNALFIETLNPYYYIQYWAWPATIMRSITAAYKDTSYFAKGKVLVSGTSKNGTSPTIALINDTRITALHAAFSAIWDSPLRYAIEEDHISLHNENLEYINYLKQTGAEFVEEELLRHEFLAGTFGTNYNHDALEKGHSWDSLHALAERMADVVFISRNKQQLANRKVDMLFHPGTHDYVAYDMAWGGTNHPDIPIYMKANTGHGNTLHDSAELDEKNLTVFALNHFNNDVDELLTTPTIVSHREGNTLHISVKFDPATAAETGRLWWMYDRGSDGSISYIMEMIPSENTKSMWFNAQSNTWETEIELNTSASHIDFYTNHRKTISYKSVEYPTYISSPYQRFSIATANSIIDDENNLLKVSVFPNPVKEQLNISLHGFEGKTSISIFTIIGNLLYSENRNTNDSNDISIKNLNLDNGVYLLKIIDETGNIKDTKIVVENQ